VFDTAYTFFLSIASIIRSFASAGVFNLAMRLRRRARFYGGRAKVHLTRKGGWFLMLVFARFSSFRRSAKRVVAHRDESIILNTHDFTAMLAPLSPALDPYSLSYPRRFCEWLYQPCQRFWLFGCLHPQALPFGRCYLCVSEASAQALIDEFGADPKKTKRIISG